MPIRLFSAGAEVSQTAAALHAAGIKNVLLTAYQDMQRKKPVVGSLSRNFPGVILDSGMFSFMFGPAGASIKGGEAEVALGGYYDRLINFIQCHVPVSVTCVELDCQKILGPDLAWSMRWAMKEALPEHTIMNVFHLEDLPRFQELVQYSDYLGIGAKEIRACTKDAGLAIHSLVCQAKRIKPDIKIHILGCTDKTILAPIKNLVYSVDSTTWLSPLKNGISRYLEKTDRTQELSQKIRHSYSKLFGIDPPEAFPGRWALSATVCANRFQRRFYHALG